MYLYSYATKSYFEYEAFTSQGQMKAGKKTVIQRNLISAYCSTDYKKRNPSNFCFPFS